MALDPNIDPMLAAQLYGEHVPSLADMAPPPSTVAPPWSWVPSHWDDVPVEQLAPDALAAGMPSAELAAPPPELPIEVEPLPGDLAPPTPIPLPPPIDTLPSMRPPTAPTAPPAAAPPALQLPGMDAAERVAGAARSLPDNPLEYADPEMRRRAVNALAVENPAAFAELMLRHTDERDKHIAARRAEIINRDYDQQIANLKDRQEADRITQQKTQELLASADRIFSTKIDPTGGVTGVRRLAGVAQAVIGGLIQGRTGAARNAGLDAFVDTINRGIEAQKADLENQRAGLQMRRSALADEFRRHGDMFLAQEAVRLAALKHADELLATEQQNFDPAGTQALKIAAVRAGIGAEQQKGMQAFQDKKRDNHMKEREQRRKEAETEAQIQNQRTQNYLRSKEIDAAAEDRKLARQQRADDKALERADKEAERRRQFAIGGIPKVRVGADGNPVMGPDGKPAIDYDVLRNSDGSVWEAESPEATRELRIKKTTTTELKSIIDEIREIRGRVGGESRLLNSKDVQRLSVLKARAQLITKQGTQGMSSDQDMGIIVDSAGTGDADSWRDQDAKLLEARARSIGALNQALRDAKYSGPSIEFPEAQPTESTLDEIKFEGLLTKPDESLDQARQRIDEARAGGFDVGYNPDASIKQQVGIARLGQEATGPADDQGAALARTRLQKIAAEAPTSALRQLARATLESALRSGLGSAEETTTASGAREPRGEQSVATPVPDELRAR